MPKLIYSAITSLGGYVADEDGNFDWAEPDQEVFIAPVVVGGGKQSLASNVRLKLELMDEWRFGSGVVHLRYRTGA